MPPKITKAWLKEPVKNIGTMSAEDIANVMQQCQLAYYNTSKPLVSDDIYDIFKEKLEELDPTNPILFNVGAVLSERKVKLPVYMGSMDKMKADKKELDSFVETYKGTYVISDKLDGNSALFVIKEGKQFLYSRGNGIIGQDISHLIPFVHGFPKSVGADSIVRGELIISKKNWAHISDKGANARNTVAGIVNAKVPDLKVAKLTTFVAYSVILPDELTFSKQMTWLKQKGFVPVYHHKVKKAKTEMIVDWLSTQLAKRREESDYEIDGLIVSHDAYYPVTAGKNPKHAFAFKHLLTKETAEVIVTKVEWNISKDGLIKPTVLFLPIKLAGVTIQRATGFNGDYIKTNTIGPGAHLLITRSGDVIPHIIETLSQASNGTPQMPDIPWVWTEGNKDIKIKGKSTAMDMKQIVHFFETIKVKGFSEGTITKLYKAGYTSVKSIAEIDDTNGIIRPALVSDIKKRIKEATCLQLMHASNVFGQGFGERKLAAITSALKDMVPTVNELVKIDGVSKITAEKFMLGLTNYKKFLKDTGLSCEDKAEANANGTKFAGQVIVFTGFRNKEWEQIVIENGGTIGASITSKTTLVVAKDPNISSGKLDGARAKGIAVVGMDEWKTRM